MKHFYFTLLLGLLCIPLVRAQSVARPELYSQVIPPPPNAASLGKFANLPVSLYSGIPQIGVPLYTVEVGELKLPISLDYHASGIAVAELASWVGLGWSLNAGGVITRSIRGLPDDGTAGFALSPQFAACSQPVNKTNNFQNIFDPIGQGRIDGEPDMFYFNFGGKSGKFVIDRNRQVHIIPYQKLRIKPNGGTGDAFTSWEVTTEDGAVYVFSEAEQVQTITTSHRPGATTSSSFSSYNSWYLTEVRSPRDRQKITLTYASQPQHYLMPGSETHYEFNTVSGYGCVRKDKDNTADTKTIIDHAKLLASITFPTGSIEFKPGPYRYDLSGGQVLDQVTVKAGGQVVKSFHLTYGYFSTGSMQALSPATATESDSDNNYLRLALQSVQEYGSNSILAKGPYRFEYEQGAWLPNRITSKAQDHWGFYNGADANKTLIPPHKYGGSGDLVDGAQRLPVERYAKAGSLTKITYPTGGFTAFQYELNETEQETYAADFVPISLRLGIGHCSATSSQAFDINDEVTGQTQLSLGFDGARFPVTEYSGCSNPKFSLSNPSSFIHFKLFKIEGTTQNPTYIDVMAQQDKNLDAQFTLGYASQAARVTLKLPNGHYQMSAVRGKIDANDVYLPGTTWVEVKSGQVNTMDVYYVDVSAITYKQGSKKIGGLRLKEMTDYDHIVGKSTVKTYAYRTTAGLSSGLANYVPRYDYRFLEGLWCDDTSGGTYREAVYQVYSSSSNIPLTTTQGGNVGYSQVTVYDGKSTNGEIGINGKTDYYYTSSSDKYAREMYVNEATTSNTCFDPDQVLLEDIKNQPFPFAPLISQDWARGLLLQQTDYKREGSEYVKVKEVLNTYKDDYLGDCNQYNPATDVLATKVGTIASRSRQETAINLYDYSIQYYWIPSRFVKLVRSQESLYNPKEQYQHTTVREFNYDNLAHLEPSRTTLIKDNHRVVEQVLYPGDYTNTTGFIGEMKQANIIAKPIEKIRYQTDLAGNNAQILTGSLFTYQQGVQIGLISKAWQLETTQPIGLAEFKFSNQPSTGTLPHMTGPGEFSLSNRDSRYPEAPHTTLGFDAKGNIQQVLANKGTPTSYLWGYNSTLVVAQIRNASSSQVQAALGVDVNTFTTDQQLRDAFKQLRQRLPQALITSFTHQPEVGMTSQTDPTGRTTTYEYDALGRLIRTRDEQNRILSQQQYHYAGK